MVITLSKFLFHARVTVAVTSADSYDKQNATLFNSRRAASLAYYSEVFPGREPQLTTVALKHRVCIGVSGFTSLSFVSHDRSHVLGMSSSTVAR